MSVIVRKAQEADLPAVLLLENLSYPSPWPRAFFEGHLGEEGFMICEEAGQIIGYIVVGIKIPTLFERLEKRTRALVGQPVDLEELRGHIMNIAIEPGRRHQGLGAMLLRHGLEHLSRLEANTAELEVRVGNIPAISLYEKFGFEIKRRVFKYYQNGEDAYLMIKQLRQT